jgi:hypothetical protein
MDDDQFSIYYSTFGRRGQRDQVDACADAAPALVLASMRFMPRSRRHSRYTMGLTRGGRCNGVGAVAARRLLPQGEESRIEIDRHSMAKETRECFLHRRPCRRLGHATMSIDHEWLSRL